MKSTDKKIVLDVDGVLLDFIGGITAFAQEYFNQEIIIHGKFFDLEQRFGLNKKQVDELWQAFGENGGWKNLKAFDGAKIAVEKIIAAGFTPYVVTGLDYKFENQRLDNLYKELNFVPHQIYCMGHGQSPKNKIIEKINPDIFIDDNLLHLHKVHGVFHLAWIDHSEEQFPEPEKGVDSRVHSIKEWTDNYLEHVTKEIDNYHNKKEWIQRKLRFI